MRRGKVVRTTISDANAPCPLDRVKRQSKADRPNQLWVSDFTYVSTWQSWQYVAFVIDVYARRIVGWRQSSSMETDFVLDAPEPSRCPSPSGIWYSVYVNLGCSIPATRDRQQLA